jgi:signal-transduction protein with cAMP-binding, CBS, and nucleotidyltransferase domain
MKYPSTVSDIMTDIISIEGTTLVETAAKTMIDHKIGSIIVTKDGKPVGIITKSDMLSRVIVAYKDPRVQLTKEIMSSPLISVPVATTLLEAMRDMRDKDVTHLLIKGDNEYVGIISEGDMVRAVTLSSLTQFTSLLR